MGVVQQIGAYTWVGLAAVFDEDWPQAVSALEHCRALAQSSTFRFMDPLWMSHLALAYAGRGDAAARATAEQAVAAAREQGTVRFEMEAQVALARVLLTIGDADDWPAVEAALTRAQECVNETGYRVHLPIVTEERGRLARLRGDEAAAERELREAHRVYDEIGATGHAARLAKELGL